MCTAVTPQPHTPAPTTTLVGSSTCPLTTPTSSAVACLLGSVQTLGSSIRKVKPLPPPPQVPSFQEYLRQQAAQRTPRDCVPRATGSNRKCSALSHLNGVTPPCNTGHTTSCLSGHPPPPYTHTPLFTRTEGTLAFHDNFTSPAPQPLPPVTQLHICNTTFTVTSPHSTVSTRCSDMPSRGSSCVSHHHFRGLPLGAPLSNTANHRRQERKVPLSVNLGEW